MKLKSEKILTRLFPCDQESCKCIEELAKAVPEKFHYHGESLIKPLLMSVSHQHHKVRVLCLRVSRSALIIYLLFFI